MRTGLYYGLLTALLLPFCGCTNAVNRTIESYHAAAPQIQLGMSKQDVLKILEPTQQTLPLSQRRGPEQYYQGDIHVEIVFFRSSVNYDNILTDDEFTPYVFHDGALYAIGWTAIGGPKTQAMPRPIQQINIVR